MLRHPRYDPDARLLGIGKRTKRHAAGVRIKRPLQARDDTMTRATGTRFEPQRLVVLAVALAALASCDEALISGDAAKEKPPADAQDTEGATELFPDVANGSQRDVEAPDVFDVTEAGLWDGRPSLGGIWVAHPDAKQPERVLIKNAANNKSVTGALFRRERNLPGPALQVSSSAAEQLGMLAGSPRVCRSWRCGVNKSKRRRQWPPIPTQPPHPARLKLQAPRRIRLPKPLRKQPRPQPSESGGRRKNRKTPALLRLALLQPVPLLRVLRQPKIAQPP